MRIDSHSSYGWRALAAWSEVRAARAQLAADQAAGADPQVIAADRASITGSARLLAHTASKLDVYL